MVFCHAPIPRKKSGNQQQQHDALALEPGFLEAPAIVPRQLLDSDTVLCGTTEKKRHWMVSIFFANESPTSHQHLLQVTNAGNTIDSGTAMATLRDASSGSSMFS